MADLSKIKLNGTEYDLKDAVARAAINDGLKLQVVKELPSENIDENTLYLVPNEPNIIKEATTTISSTTTSSTTIRITSIPFVQGNIYNVNVNAKAIYQEADVDTVSYQGSFIWNGETITLLQENNWVITAESNKIKGVYSGANKDSLEISALVKETRIENQYDCYIFVNEQWEKVNDSNQFMIKGVDYVTAGQKEGTSLGTCATAEGISTTASGTNSHAEGYVTTASANCSHAEGFRSNAQGVASHVEGTSTVASANSAHAEGYGSASSLYGLYLTGAANATTYTVYMPNQDYLDGLVPGQKIGINTATATHTIQSVDNDNKTITVDTTLSETALDRHSFAIVGEAAGKQSHVEGYATRSGGESAHAEGAFTVASGVYSHAEGYGTLASRGQSHAEGMGTRATNTNAHAEGYWSEASGIVSHAEGAETQAAGAYSHVEGRSTIAQRRSQHVFGEYNIADPNGTATTRGTYVEIIGNGTSAARSNARTLDWSGNETLAGKLTIGAAPVNDMDVATKQYVDTAMSNVTVPTVEDMANVTAMLTSYGLNTTTTLSAAAAGTAELDSAVVQGV